MDVKILIFSSIPPLLIFIAMLSYLSRHLKLCNTFDMLYHRPHAHEPLSHCCVRKLREKGKHNCERGSIANIITAIIFTRVYPSPHPSPLFSTLFSTISRDTDTVYIFDVISKLLKRNRSTHRYEEIH